MKDYDSRRLFPSTGMILFFVCENIGFEVCLKITRVECMHAFAKITSREDGDRIPKASIEERTRNFRSPMVSIYEKTLTFF